MVVKWYFLFWGDALLVVKLSIEPSSENFAIELSSEIFYFKASVDLDLVYLPI